ncbi:MAG: bifunctional AP-4-A phosphorylase/ADP sulfurylase [Peltula sp. TS41687]|nr:MAG: bifunctional AP-4-A phosphorylase/ADP sulfurylase [Peltula sp. TS41687]
MRLELRDKLSNLVKARFNAAKANGSLIFSSTELTVIYPSGVPYQLRYCPALAKKPDWERTSSPTVQKTPKVDPFHDPPADLLIAEIPASKPSHLLVLNKYPVIPNHFILATKTYKDQRRLLEEDDLGATLACLRTWAEEGAEAPKAHQRMTKLFAFFNSGKHSGASQPHRHIQFLPVEDMVRESGTGKGWRLLVEDPALHLDDDAKQRTPPGFPFVYFHARLSPEHTPRDIHRIYMKLYDQAISAVESYDARHPRDAIEMEDDDGEGWASISYNLAMTTTSMMLCPRRAEGADLILNERGECLGQVDLNGTILAGTLMVSSEYVWHALRCKESRLNDLLEGVGIPPASVHSQAAHAEGKL